MLNLTDDVFLSDPSSVLTKVRAEGPLTKSRFPIIGPLYVTTTDAAAREVLKDTELFRRDPTPITGKSLAQSVRWLPRSMVPLTKNMVTMDGDDHRRLRKLVDQAFMRTSIDMLRPEIERIADHLLDQIDPTRPTDIVEPYSRELPFEVICLLLGIERRHWPVLKKRIKPISSVNSAAMAFWAFVRLGKTTKLIRQIIDEARDTNAPGLIGELARVEADGERLSADECLAMVFTLFVAGHETTVHLINNMILGFIDRPDLKDIDDSDMFLVVEEFMRHASPVMSSKMHFVARDVNWHGVDLKKGDRVAALLIAANRDPARFDRPDTLVPDRRPNAHLGFGHGPHVCLGMQLARAEAQVAVNRLFNRYPTATLAGPRDSVTFLKRAGIRGPKGLRLILRP